MITETIKSLLPESLQKITYIGEFPTDVDNCIVIAEASGPHGQYFAQDMMNTPYIKIGVRNNKYPDGHSLINQCKKVLTGYADASTLGVVLINDIMYFGRDDKRRNVFQLTFKVFSFVKQEGKI